VSQWPGGVVVITPQGMISDEYALEVLRALSKADRFGMSLHDLACAMWPDRERDARQHSALGAALAELAARKLVVASPGKRSRYALSPEGTAWLRRYQVTPATPEAAAPWRPAPAPVLDPIEAAIQACVAPSSVTLPPGTTGAEAYARGQAMGRVHARADAARLRAACRGDEELYQLAAAEADRRMRTRIAELEAEIIAAGEDPFAYDGAGAWAADQNCSS
jgi:hypothetical protein